MSEKTLQVPKILYLEHQVELLVAGLEPARCCHRGILSPLRLPIPPHQRNMYIAHRSHMQMDGGGFEPPKQFAADLQSVPFGHSGIHPFVVKHYPDHVKL